MSRVIWYRNSTERLSQFHDLGMVRLLHSCGQMSVLPPTHFSPTSDASDVAAAINPVAPTTGADGRLRLACSICGATTSRRGRPFENPSDLARHLRSSHGEVSLESPSTNKPRRVSQGSSNESARSVTKAIRQSSTASHVKFCPCCGFNLSVVNAAMSFVADQETLP